MRHFLRDFFSPPQTRALSFFIDWIVTALSTISCTSSIKGKVWTEISLEASSLAQNTDPFVNSPLVESSSTLSSFTEQDAVIVIRSILDAIDYLHHSIVTKYAFLSLSFSSLENIFYHYNDPDSDSGIVYFGM